MLLAAAVSLPFNETPAHREGRVATPRFELLGEVRASRDGVDVDLGPAKQRAVLAVLLLNAGRAVPTHRIVDAVWGDDPPENGANVVQKYVAGLRRVLDPDRAPRTPGELITLTGGGYTLNAAPDSLDVERFRSGVARAARERADGRLAEAAVLLSRALDLWRGPALAGLTGTLADSARDTLAEEHGTAWESWAEIELARGDHATLVPDLVRLVTEFPLREGLRALLMLALHRAGRQAEALAVFQEARRFLDDEFGVEPGALLREAHQTVLRGEPIRVVAPVPVVAPAVAPPPDPAPVSPPAPRPIGPPLVEPPPAGRRRVPLSEVLFAGLTPIVLCSAGSWIYFAVSGVRRHDARLFLVAGAYLFAFIGFFATVGESTPDGVAQTVGMVGLFGVAVIASVHGLILATHPRYASQAESRRAEARLIAATDPARAREIGIGRPDLPRGFDDGGLIDVNHVPGYELSRLRGLDPATAHRIVMDRHQHGPYVRLEDLVSRGLITPDQLHRLGSRLICVPGGLNREFGSPLR
jgi:DNA-binding SARP family transcriptional activator